MAKEAGYNDRPVASAGDEEEDVGTPTVGKVPAPPVGAPTAYPTSTDGDTTEQRKVGKAEAPSEPAIGEAVVMGADSELAAPHVPGGAVVSAAVSGLGSVGGEGPASAGTEGDEAETPPGTEPATAPSDEEGRAEYFAGRLLSAGDFEAEQEYVTAERDTLLTAGLTAAAPTPAGTGEVAEDDDQQTEHVSDPDRAAAVEAAARWLAAAGADSLLAEFLKLQATDPNNDPATLSALYEAMKAARRAELDAAQDALDSATDSQDTGPVDLGVQAALAANGSTDDWGAFVADLATGGVPQDINSLVQSVLRDAYLETNKDLAFYADKVRYYNDLKKQIRGALTDAREAMSRYTQANPAVQDESGWPVVASENELDEPRLVAAGELPDVRSLDDSEAGGDTVSEMGAVRGREPEQSLSEVPRGAFAVYDEGVDEEADVNAVYVPDGEQTPQDVGGRVLDATAQTAQEKPEVEAVRATKPVQESPLEIGFERDSGPVSEVVETVEMAERAEQVAEKLEGIAGVTGDERLAGVNQDLAEAVEPGGLMDLGSLREEEGLSLDRDVSDPRAAGAEGLGVPAAGDAAPDTGAGDGEGTATGTPTFPGADPRLASGPIPVPYPNVGSTDSGSGGSSSGGSSSGGSSSGGSSSGGSEVKGSSGDESGSSGGVISGKNQGSSTPDPEGGDGGLHPEAQAEFERWATPIVEGADMGMEKADVQETLVDPPREGATRSAEDFEHHMSPEEVMEARTSPYIYPTDDQGSGESPFPEIESRGPVSGFDPDTLVDPPETVMGGELDGAGGIGGLPERGGTGQPDFEEGEELDDAP